MANNLDLISESFTRGIVSPLNNFGLGGFIFDIDDESTVNLTTEITDHYLEDNTTVQDHIAVRPKKIVMKSFVGELVFRLDDDSDTPVQKVVQKLTSLTPFLPVLTRGATQAVDAIQSGRLTDISLQNVTVESINKTIDYWALVKNLSVPQSRQQQAYQYFKALQEQKILVSVQTPFEFMTNMAIEVVTARQGGETRYTSDFSITLKEIRTTSLKNAAFNADQYAISEGTPEELFQGRAVQQRTSLENIGNMDGVLEPGYNLDDLMTDDMYRPRNVAPLPGPDVQP